MSEAKRMWAIFDGFDGAHGTHGEPQKNLEKGGKLEIKGTARTVRQPVTLRLWEDHLAGRHPLGIIPTRRDNTCVWGCIDVDKYDLDLADIVRRLEKAVLPMIVCRTKSGGAHIFLFAATPIGCDLMRSRLMQIAAFLGFGGSEIFPKQTNVLSERGDMGNWLNMPYLAGDSTERYAVNKTGRGLTLGQFLSVAEAVQMSEQAIYDLEIVPEKGGKVQEGYGDGPPCLEHLSGLGFPQGTRNNGLFNIATLLKRKFPDDWEERLEQENQRVMTPPLSSEEVTAIIRSQRKADYKYKCKDQPLCSHCNGTLCRTRKFGVGEAGTMPTMESLSKLDTDEPVWFMDVGGRRIELSTDDLQQPARFQKRCMEVINVMVPVLKKNTWDDLIARLMANVTLIEAPAETGIRGQFHEHIETFCTDRQQAQTRDEIILGKAWREEESGRFYFRIKDVQEHLEKAKFRGMTRTQMTMAIRSWGGEPHFFNIKGKGVNVWWVPQEIFSVQLERHDLPASREEVL